MITPIGVDLLREMGKHKGQFKKQSSFLSMNTIAIVFNYSGSRIRYTREVIDVVIRLSDIGTSEFTKSYLNSTTRNNMYFI